MFNHQWKLWDRLLLILPITCSVLLLTKTPANANDLIKNPDELAGKSSGTKLVGQPLNVKPAIAQTPQKNAIATEESLSAQEFVSPEMEQVNSVSQLSDVNPTDWAFAALQSLVERYGCIAGYPNRTYGGDRAMTRYEFAAGLHACLDRIKELIATSTADLVNKQDLETLRKLQQEFAPELAVLRNRVDSLEAKAATLEANQFSTTTKLFGNAIFAVSDVFGEDGGTNQSVFQYRANLNLASSFTGRDVLLMSLFSGNVPLGTVQQQQGLITGPFNLAGVDVDIPGVATVRNSTAEGTLSSQFGANTSNGVLLAVLAYSFPLTDDLNVAIVNSFAPFQLYAPTLNPYFDDKDAGTGAISVFGEYNPIYTLSGGGTGVILNYKIGSSLTLTGGYLADGFVAGNPNRGLFNGGYGALGQLTWNVTDNFSVAGVYTNDYAPPRGRFGFNYNALAVTGTAVANTLAGQDPFSPVVTNGYGVQFSWKVNPGFAVNGWFSTFYPRLIGQGDGNILTYALNFAFPDFGKKGNLLGFVFGAEPYLTDFDGGNPQAFKVDVPLHIEGFYRYQLTDRISITPGVIWLTAPNQDRDNGSDIIATLRTTFQF
ncbi:iron uptake porin [Fischerella sp. PCC 9605]|uniref:iron uptake porin n=1 Tax=Fischerella sp. PCC 9605 TaxID=1173024 RepID=UPI00047B05AA|nr:iron uptake porin [Fischerella sp. PCC 9605]